MELFSALTGDDLAEIACVTEEETFDEGTTVVREGELGDRLYFVVTGQVQVCSGNRVLAVMGEREVFGEMALLDPGPRSASVVAISPVTLLAIARDDFDDLMRERPEVPTGVMRILVRRLRTR
jgi:CRP-like cAMP-binding protein